VKTKVVALIFLTIFAALTSSLVVGLSSSRVFEGKVDFSKHYSIVQIGINDTQTQGEPITTPEMPG
jgi:hypothetical protein